MGGWAGGFGGLDVVGGVTGDMADLRVVGVFSGFVVDEGVTGGMDDPRLVGVCWSLVLVKE